MEIKIYVDKVEAVEDGKLHSIYPEPSNRLTSNERMLMELWLIAIGWEKNDT